MTWTSFNDHEPYAYKDVTIPSGATGLSDGFDLKGYTLVRIDMPAAWTAANLTFQVSTDDSTYNDLYISDAEYTLTAAASRALGVAAADGVRMHRYLKVRSGTSGAPVDQGTDRVLRLVGYEMS